MRSISGFVNVRNGEIFDFCWRLSVESLLPVCDEVLICDGGSTDGTRDLAFDWSRLEPKIRVVDYDLGEPYHDIHFWVKWCNWTRRKLRYDYQLMLDADEVLDPKSYPAVRLAADEYQAAWIEKLNFWMDPWHMQAVFTANMGPTHLPIANYEGDFPVNEINLRTEARHYPNLRLFHYGTLRKPEAFVDKQRFLLRAFFGDGGMDPKIEKAVTEHGDWRKGDYSRGDAYGSTMDVGPWSGEHPELAKAWLRERGHQI